MKLRVLLFQDHLGDETVWVAQCLEHDISAQGDTAVSARANIEETIAGEIVLALEMGYAPLSEIRPAPSKYHVMWETARLAEDAAASALQFNPPARMPLPDARAEFRVAGLELRAHG